MDRSDGGRDLSDTFVSGDHNLARGLPERGREDADPGVRTSRAKGEEVG
jgi:hypothetical protein